MAGTYTRLFYHLVWATKERNPLITPRLEPELYGYIRGKCSEIGAVVHALDGTENHTHLVCSVPASLSLAGFLHKIKGASSHFANQTTGSSGSFWQPGYGALTFASRDLAWIVRVRAELEAAPPGGNAPGGHGAVGRMRLTRR